MKKFYVLIILVSCFKANCQTDSLLLNYEYYSLDNGLEVVLQPDPNVTDVSVEFWLKDGIRIDKPNQYGFSHFFEHVMPFGEMDSSSRAMLASLRTGSNAQVKKDYIRFNVKVRPEGLELALQMVAGRLKAGSDRISERRVELQRKRVLSEIERNAKNPVWSAPGGMAIYAGTFGENHPYGSSGYGLIENNLNFKLDEFKDRYDEIVYANNTILFLVGNFNKKEAIGYINEHFSDIPSNKKTSQTVALTRHSSHKMTASAPHKKDTLNSLVLSWAVPKWGTQEDGTLKIIGKILKNRFDKSVDFPNSMTEISVDTDMFQFGGQFLIKASFSTTKNSTKMEQTILNEIKEFSQSEALDTEISLAKQSEINDLADMHQYLGFQWSRTELLGESLLFTGNPGFYYERLEKQLELDEKQIRLIANKYLVEKPFRILFTSND